MRTHDQLWRADILLFHFKPIFSGMELDIEKQSEEEIFPSTLQLRCTKCTVSSTYTPSRHLLATRRARVNGTGGKETSGQRSSLTEKTVGGLIAVAVGGKTRFKRNVEERMDKLCVSVCLWRREFYHGLLCGW